jgi:hypothetical protein
MSEDGQKEENAIPELKSPETLKPFFHKNGMGQTVLRLKDDESLEDGVSRLRRDGWLIPDLGQLQQKEDATGKYFVLR